MPAVHVSMKLERKSCMVVYTCQSLNNTKPQKIGFSLSSARSTPNRTSTGIYRLPRGQHKRPANKKAHRSGNPDPTGSDSMRGWEQQEKSCNCMFMYRKGGAHEDKRGTYLATQIYIMQSSD